MISCPIMKRPEANGRHATFTKDSNLLKANTKIRLSQSTQGVKTSSNAEMKAIKVLASNDGEKKINHGQINHPGWEWCFDNAANVHVSSDLRYFIYYEPFTKGKHTDSVLEISKGLTSTSVGHGTV